MGVIELEYAKIVGTKIRELRDKRGLSLRDAGDALGLDYSYLGRIERGFLPSTKVIKNIAEFYNVDISSILGEEIDIPKEMENKIKKWYRTIEKYEERGYSPEDIEKLLETLDRITGINNHTNDK